MCLFVPFSCKFIGHEGGERWRNSVLVNVFLAQQWGVGGGRVKNLNCRLRTQVSISSLRHQYFRVTQKHNEGSPVLIISE